MAEEPGCLVLRILSYDCDTSIFVSASLDRIDVGQTASVQKNERGLAIAPCQINGVHIVRQEGDPFAAARTLEMHLLAGGGVQGNAGYPLESERRGSLIISMVHFRRNVSKEKCPTAR